MIGFELSLPIFELNIRSQTINFKLALHFDRISFPQKPYSIGNLYLWKISRAFSTSSGEAGGVLWSW